MNQPEQVAELTLEQQLNLRSFELQVEQMSKSQAQQLLIEIYGEMMKRENSYKLLLQHKWFGG